MVARHHDDLDSGLAAFLYRTWNLSARRILEPNQSEKDQIVLEFVVAERGGKLFRRERENAQAPLGHRLLCANDQCALRSVERSHLLAGENAVAQRQHGFGRSLAVEHRTFRHVVHDGMTHAIAVKGNFVKAPTGWGSGDGLVGHFEQCDLHGVAEERAAPVTARILHVMAKTCTHEEVAVAQSELSAPVYGGHRIAVRHRAAVREPACGFR